MKYLLGIVVVGLLCAAPRTTYAAVNVFACEPEWAALAKEIGGDHVKVFSATHAKQDPHYIRARPSLIAKARRADLVFCSGSGLESGWLPILLQKARADVQRGSKGHLMASEFVPILGKPEVVDRSMGDVHPEGNPHVHLNPDNILLVAKELTKRLALIDTAHATFYKNQLQDFTGKWKKSMLRWKKKTASLKGARIVVHHKAFSYLLHWLGVKIVASLEPKPGIPPTTSHLEKLLQKLKSSPADIIIRTPYETSDASIWLSEKTNTPAVVLPYTIGGDDMSGNLFKLFDQSMNLLKGTVHDQP